MPPPLPLTFFALSFLIDFFFEAVGNMLQSLGKLSRIANFLFRSRYFKKTLFFALPPPTLGSVAQTTHA